MAAIFIVFLTGLTGFPAPVKQKQKEVSRGKDYFEPRRRKGPQDHLPELRGRREEGFWLVCSDSGRGTPVK